MGQGNIRNQKCLCGSNKKYKYCCGYNKEIELYVIENIVKDKHNIKMCLAPIDSTNRCSRKIIKAHTISKSSNLKTIAKNGHILTINNIFENLKNKTNSSLLVKQVGINKASTHNMFCEIHDKELFSVLENQTIIFSKEQMFKLTYRNICKELFEKYGIVNNKNEVFETLMNKNNTYKIHQHSTHIGIRDLEYIKAILDKNLLNQNFDNIRFYAIIFDKILPIMTSCAVLPHIDLQKNRLLDIEDENKYYNYISISTLAINNKGAIVFSWISKDDETNKHCYQFIKSLIALTDKQKCGAILNFLFTYSENTYWSEDWWNSLKEEEQDALLMCALDSTQNITLVPENFNNFADFLNLSIEKIINETNV